MIYQSVSGIGLSTASGYGAGWILAAMSNAPVNSGALIGAVSGLAYRILNVAVFLVAKKYSLEDQKVYILKAATTAVVGAISLFALARIGISPFGLVITGFLMALDVSKGLDDAMRYPKSTYIIDSQDINKIFTWPPS